MIKITKAAFRGLCLFILFVLSSNSLVFGQASESADVMRSNGKIYVVLAVVLTILAGFIFYLIRLDRKISRLEKQA